MSEGTIHTATGWKTDGKYGLYRRTAANDKGEGAGFEVLLKADKKVAGSECLVCGNTNVPTFDTLFE